MASHRPSTFLADLVHWAMLIALSALIIGSLLFFRFSAAWLLGPMVAAIILAFLRGPTSLPSPAMPVAQALVGCFVAAGMKPEILSALLSDWPLFLIGVSAVILISIGLGGVLTAARVLPGTTALWGAFPGAAPVMVLMAEAFGADVRLVALMQFIRLGLVICVASVVIHIVGTPVDYVPPVTVWWPTLDWIALGGTIAVAVASVVAGIAMRIPGGPFLVSLAVSSALSHFGLLTITLPPWLMAASYTIIGLSIGSRFTPSVLLLSARAIPYLGLSALALIGLCAGVGYFLHLVSGMDFLTAYLATSPGGADAIAVLAASSPVDAPFVVAMQSVRFFLILLIGPALSRVVAKLVDPKLKAD